MCGRYVRITPAATFAHRMGLPAPPEPELFPPRYNVAPSQPALAVAADKAGARHFGQLRWGFVPRWAADAKKAPINARAETAAGSPFFADSLLRRCLIPADGFYEWQQLPGRRKQPFVFRLCEDQPFAFAGLWDVWQRPAGPRAGFCILTTQANDLVQAVHARMPIIVGQQHYDLWLSRDVQEQGALAEVLRPYPADAMHAFAVSSRVNDAHNEGPECLLPVA